MPTLDVSLGSLTLESRDSGWQARVHNVATFTASKEDELLRLNQRLTAGALNEYSDDLPWIARGYGFRLILCLRLDLLVSAKERDAITATLATQLRTAKFWAQLSLNPTIVETSGSASDHQTITVSLDYDSHLTRQTARQVHKLDIDVPFQDLRPPPGIPLVTMQTVHLDMNLYKCRRRKRRRVRPSNEQILTMPAANVALSEGFEDFSLSAPTQNDARRGSYPAEGYEEELHFEAFDWHLDDGDEDDVLELDDETMLGESEYENEIANEDFHHAFPPLLKRTSSISDLDLDAQASSTEGVLDLVDAAIRNCIIGTPRHISKGIVVTATESLQHLAPLVPSLWSPSYLPIVASRAVFIPTISHAVKAVCSKSNSSNKPGSKPRTLFRDGEESRSSKSAIPAANLSTSIWRLLCRSLFSPQASRQLAPLSVPIDGVVLEPTAEENMLDSNQWNLEDDVLNEEDEILLDDFEYEAPVMEDLCCGDEMLDDDVLSVSDKLDFLHLLDYEESQFAPGQGDWDATELLDF